MSDTARIKCHDCDQTVPDHMWGKIKAEGWFFQKDGTAYCPAHVPVWVDSWRERNSGP